MLAVFILSRLTVVSRTMTSKEGFKTFHHITPMTITLLASRLEHTWRSVMETLWDSTVGRRGKRGEEWGDVMGE